MGTRPMTAPTPTSQVVTPRVSQRWRTWRWLLLGVLVIAALAAITAYLTAPSPGGRMDPDSTDPDGAHALVALLRDHGVDVVVAHNVGQVERAMRPDSLLLVSETFFLVDDDVVKRIADTPGDRLIVEPLPTTRAALAPKIRIAPASGLGGEPHCALPEATRAGRVQLGFSDSYQAADHDVSLTRCYDGAVVRYRDGNRTVTVVGTADFMVNSGLLKEGNAALAMNLAGDRPRLVWYAPRHVEGESSNPSSLTDLIPRNVKWMVWQLWLVVLLVAVWRGRRLGPLVAENLPVVVRASETVEGRGRLYRSRRARDRAADALRTATLQRTMPRLGLTATAEPAAVVAAVAARSHRRPDEVYYALYGPVPATDTDLVTLARQLDDIERQVAQS